MQSVLAPVDVKARLLAPGTVPLRGVPSDEGLTRGPAGPLGWGPESDTFLPRSQQCELTRLTGAGGGQRAGHADSRGRPQSEPAAPGSEPGFPHRHRALRGAGEGPGLACKSPPETGMGSRA